ncbi:type II toxin-antitoxin system RelE/ParE family toxin [Acetatifactor muris]|uniref:Plasmid stabilization system protein n=1 Tax=Acetatifactor muris TaxID=879566 RepID=A0A2K4ZHR1_9FIRM|nr:type II toxin-antitoxin system RelE/ParE family toxin [Acetatifactor muris]MCR2048213.1 type II toxin-antitoxin system RelE/ParE family toxin [Acetatifactor muris]SOY30023.1 Plasmid stabilization system protein [Acetatifactor muris]
MPKLIYAPKALDDIQGIKTYVSKQFGANKAKACIRDITSTVRQLEIFPEEGLCVEDLIEYPTDYRYLVVKPNYVFYRIEDDIVRVIRIINEKQDFLQILFGISSISDEGEEYWDRNE